MKPTLEDPMAADAPASPDKDELARQQKELTRRRFLRGAALTGVGVIGAGVAACTTNVVPSLMPTGTSSAPASGVAASGMASSSQAPLGAIPRGWSEHDLEARNVVRRYVGNLAPALKGIYGDATFAKLAEILGAADNYPEL
ncbi:MAG: hypothetical protein ABIZ57_01370, partial [Candidatus Limnocylindria bacterium]